MNPAATPQLVAEGIHKRYGATEVLKGVSVQAQAGDVTSLIGASGSGKSTFLRCLNLLEAPNAGRISVGGEALALVPDRHGALKARDPAQLQRLRTQVAMVFQHFNLWAHMTALENVIEAPMQVLGLTRAQAVERAEAYLQRVGVIHRKNAYPAHLSGGEQQRVAIARALINAPEVIIADEPTANLDTKLSIEFMGILETRVDQGKTVLLTSHDPLVVESSLVQRVLEMRDGRIVPHHHLESA